MTIAREILLREMGLTPVWKLRGREEERELLGSSEEDDLNERPPEPDQHAPGAPLPPSPSPPSTPPPSAGTSTAGERAPPVSHDVATASTAGDDERAARIAKLSWEELETDIRHCSACRLCERRTQTVPGTGERDAQWMLVGEGPGAEEDKRGVPFVGAAGKLLDAMLAALGLGRDRGVFITNAVKCRPPHNRTPERDEIAACRPYLERQIALLQPRLLLALGRPAAQTLLDREVRINAVRGKAAAYGSIPVVVTYHPAYLLRNPGDKARVWEDLCLARRTAGFDAAVAPAQKA